jgi:serine protease Do
VEEGSAAAQAGIQAGDVILTYDGKEVTEMSDLPLMVAATKPGTEVEVEVLRGGERETLNVVVGEFEEQQVAGGGDSESDSGPLGLVVRPLSEAQQARAGVDNGVLVEQAQGPAAKAGIRPGDILLAVNNDPIESAAQLAQIPDNYEGDAVALLVQRGSNALYVSVPLRDE